MPRRTDIETILLIGSGPIVIGQACEFDYSGTQACRILRQEGYRVVLANSNPATIMTDPDFADATYIEPLDIEVLTTHSKKQWMLSDPLVFLVSSDPRTSSVVAAQESPQLWRSLKRLRHSGSNPALSRKF